MTLLSPRLVRATPLLLTGLLLAAVVMRVPAFLKPDYWAELSHQSFAFAALALALTPIVLTGGIDLSVGSASVLAGVVIGALWRDVGLPVGLAIAGGLLAGLLAGAVNGGLVTLGVLPLVATLATRELFRGLALALSGDRPVEQFPAPLEDFWRSDPAGLPVPAYGLAVLFLLTYLTVHHTWVGRAVYAVGDNEVAARFAGLPVRGIKFGLYLWSGAVAGLCGLASVLQYRTAKAEADRSLELAAVACVVLGGVRITGGAGHVGGTLLGVLTLTALQAGLLNAAPEWRETVVGGLLLAVALANEGAARWSAARMGR
jgi:ribose/xylose/arabinose/galactoside ABC-type transport system permease subunit